MELQIDSSGGNKRKYALTEIKADIANKRLYVRRSPPDLCIWGEAPAQPNPPSREGTTALILAPNLTPKGTTIWRAGQRRQTRQLQHHQHRLKPKTTTLLGMWLKTAEAQEREMKPD
jgi:hypothetical protein